MKLISTLQAFFIMDIEYGTYSKSIQTELNFLKQISDAYRSILYIFSSARTLEKTRVWVFFHALTLDKKSRVWYDGGSLWAKTRKKL